MVIGEDFEEMKHSVCISVRKDNVSGVCNTIILLFQEWRAC